MSLILVLVSILVVLIVVDIFRKSLHGKQKLILSDIESKCRLSLVAKSGEGIASVQDVSDEYPMLNDGYLVLYYEATNPMPVRELTSLLKQYGIRYMTDNVFQKMNYNDVIFSVLPDNEKQVFESSHEGSVVKVIAVMNFKKLATLDYDINTCYELIMDMIDGLSKSYSGTMMNENGIRLTKKDRQKYLEAIS